MSERSAGTNKGKDGKAKYSSLNLYDTYKGKSVEPQKQAVSHGRGLQSLGKVGNARRVPTPTNLPSLRSEHKGNDPNINLVPGSGSGWGSEEKKTEVSAPSQAQTNPTQSSQGASAPEDPQSAKSWHPSAASVPQQGAANQHGARPVISGPPSQLDQEFPSLGMSGDQAQPAAPSNKDSQKDKDQPKEVQYGPGPSLRPQNVKSWREGGSSLNKSSGAGTGEGEGPASSPGTALDKDQPMVAPSNNMVPPSGIMNGVQGNPPPPGPIPPQFRSMMPPYMQFGGRMPGGAGGPRGPPPPPYPMGYPGPGMQGPPSRQNYPQHPNTMMQQPGPGRNNLPPRHGGQSDKQYGRNKENAPRPAIVDIKHLSDMDELAASKTEEGWAGVSGEVDYSEKLVFSDEEDDSPKKRLEKMSKHSAQESKEGKEARMDDDYNHRPPKSGEGGHHGPPGPPQPAWESNEREGGAQAPMSRGRPPHHVRMPANMDQREWSRGGQPPYEMRGHHQPHSRGHFSHRPSSHHPHGSKGQPRQPFEEDDKWNHQRQMQSNEMSSNIERARQRKLDEQKREEEEQRAAAAKKLRQLDERLAREGRDPRTKDVDSIPPQKDGHKPDISRDVQEGQNREADSRDREWDRDRERYRERDFERDRDRDRGEVPYMREGMVIKRQRTESGSSDGSRQGRDRRDGGNYPRQSTRNLPPRFLKQQQQQQQHEQQHSHQPRRQQSFPSQDQPWHGREGNRGSWGGSGPTTPTTPPFGPDHRPFNSQPRVHIQRRRENSETSTDGQDRAGHAEMRDASEIPRESDVGSGQASVSNKMEGDDRGRGNDKLFRNQRAPSEGVPREIPRRQDSLKEIQKHREQGHRQEPRSEQQEQEHRHEMRQETGQETRVEHKVERREEPRVEPRQEQRLEHKQEPKQEQGLENKQDQRSRKTHEAREDVKQEIRQETQQEPKIELRQDSRKEPRHEPLKQFRKDFHSEENSMNIKQAVQQQNSSSLNAERKPDAVSQSEKKLGKEQEAPRDEKDKKMSASTTEMKDQAAEPPKASKSSQFSEKERRPQRDTKPMPSLVDMKSTSRDKFEKGEKADRHEKGRRRDSDRGEYHGRDDRTNRRGNNEQSGSKSASSKQSDSKDAKKNESSAPEVSKAWKGQDASQRLKLKEPPSPASSDQTVNKEGKKDDKQAASVSKDEIRVNVDERRPAQEAESTKEPKDSQNEKSEKKEKPLGRDVGAKRKDVAEKPKADIRERELHPRDRREDKENRDRGGRMSGRSRGSADPNRRRDDRGPPSRREERGPAPNRRDRGRLDGGSRGRGYKTYSTGYRGRGRGRGERSERQGYRRPRQEEEDWDLSSGDESTERDAEKKDVPKQHKEGEVKPSTKGINDDHQGDDKNPEEQTGAKEPLVRENVRENSTHNVEDDIEKEGSDMRNVPKGEPSRRGRGGSSVRRGGRGGNGRSGSSRGRGRDFNRGESRDDRRPPSSRNGSQRYERGQRNEGEPRDNHREFKGRGREDEENRRPRDQRDGPLGRGGFKRARPERPPRFQKNSQGRGRVRLSRGERGPETSSVRGKENEDQSQIYSGDNANGGSKGAARPALPRQNSSDLNNDEWETASESSNFNDHKTKEKEGGQERPRASSDKAGKENVGGNPRNSGNLEARNRSDRKDNSRKGSMNQRQGGDRINNRDSHRPDYDRRDKSYRGSRDSNRPSTRGGRGRGGDRKSDFGKRPGGPRGGQEQAQNHSSDVYRLDQFTLDDQQSVQDALNAVHMRPKKGSMPMGKPLDSTTPVTLPVPAKEKEKAKPVPEKRIDVLATYDINTNYGVVVVDDVPEVIVENPDELMTPDAGFQTVLSRKQKAAESERKKLETLSEIGKKAKLGTSMKQRHPNTKLPPRLRGQAVTKDMKEPASVAPIGTGPRTGTLNKAPGTKPINTDNIPPLMGTPAAAPMAMVPPPTMRKAGVGSIPIAPPPPSNAWEKPPLLSGPQPQAPAAPAPAPAPTSVSNPPIAPAPATKVARVAGKPETSSDQHDSGVELNSDHHASNPPSQRSSPSGEAKADARLVSELMSAVGQQPKHSPLTSQPDWSTDMAPPSRLSAVGLQSVAEGAVSSHKPSFVPVSGSMMGRMEKAVTQADDSSVRNLTVDMTSTTGVIGPNALLGQGGGSHASPGGHSSQSTIMQTSQDQNRSNVQSPTSTAATDELTMKIESAKNLWDEEEESTPAAPKPNFSEGNLSSQTLGSIPTPAVSEQQQQHRGDASREINPIGDLNAGHRGHSAGSILPVSGASGITFGSFPTSDVDLVENDAPTSASFSTLATSMGTSMDSSSMELNVPSSRGFVQFSTASMEAESPPEAFTSASYTSKGLSLYTMPTVSTGSVGGTLLPSSILSHSSYDSKHIGGEQTRLHQQQQQQQQTYAPSVLLAQPFSLGSSLSNNLAIPVGSVGGNIGGNSQSVLSQSASGQYSFQGHDTSRILPGTPAFLTPGSFQGTIIQPPSGSLQFGLNQNTALAPSSPAPGAPSQQTHQSYPQAAAAGFLPTQPAPQPAPHSGLHTNFGPILSVSLPQQAPVPSPYLSLSSPSYTRPSHDMGLNSGHTTSVIMKPQTNLVEGHTKTVSSVPLTVPTVQPSHMYSQQRATSQLGAQQPGMMNASTLIAAAIQPNPTPAAAPAHHPTQGQHTSFFSGGPQVAPVANSQVGSTNFFNTLQGRNSSNLQASVQAIQPLPIQLPQTTISSQYPLTAQQNLQTSQPIHQPIHHSVGASLGAFAYGDIGTQPKAVHSRNIPSGFERQSAPSMLDGTSDLLSSSDLSLNRSSNLSQHVDAKPFSPNRQMGSSITHTTHKPHEERYSAYAAKASSYNASEQNFPNKPSSYSIAPMSIGHYNPEESKMHSVKSISSDTPKPITADNMSMSQHPKITEASSESSSTPSSLQSSLPFSMTTVTFTSATASTSHKPIYTQASKVSQAAPQNIPSALQQATASAKLTTASTTPPTLPQSVPARGFAPRSSNPRMPPQIYAPNPRMLSQMIGMHGQQMRYPPPFPQGIPPPRGTQFITPPRMPSGNAATSLPSAPTSQSVHPPLPKSTQSTPKSQSQPALTLQPGPMPSKPATSSQGSHQSNKSKSLQSLPGPSKLQKAPSHFRSRPPVDLKMTPEELKVAQNKEREKLLASTKAFFSKQGSEGETKEKSDKSDK